MKSLLSASQSFDSICSSSIAHKLTSHVASHFARWKNRDNSWFWNVEEKRSSFSRSKARNRTCFINNVPRVLDESWGRCTQWKVWIHREDWRYCVSNDWYQQMEQSKENIIGNTSTTSKDRLGRSRKGPNSSHFSGSWHPCSGRIKPLRNDQADSLCVSNVETSQSLFARML